MLFKIGLALVITLLFYLRYKVGFKLKVLFHPILLTPLVGSFFGWGGFTTGVFLGALVELLWGSNLVDYNTGLKYGLLVSLLTIVLMNLTNNISLYFNLTLVVILVYSFQESLDFLEQERYFSGLVFLFNLLVLSSAPLIKIMLGWIPAQFINSLQVSGGLIPIIGLALFLSQGVNPIFARDNVWYYAYGIATLVTAIFAFNNYYFGLIFFPVVWYTIYYLWDQIRSLKFKDYLKLSIAVLAVIIASEIIELRSQLLTGALQYILWIDLLLVLFAGLRFFKLTTIELYFIAILLGIIGSQYGLLR
ncbi:hypothetical protein Halha_2117 [Halobacteroides halobius DSM 5150]|uniref:Uncharacterized protein n=1 Tax=Halobacteroides halobius (strain ATCC 35273 / DSM 5150 / MD-1) TaxID=748449 RepID=L0KAG0_HALHC|nr:hypothetical protein [Halobacteroides halobius]AGB42001.1 hypothetical protein Halha_2117 [Halobacteroides halobius DSM 5150]